MVTACRQNLLTNHKIFNKETKNIGTLKKNEFQFSFIVAGTRWMATGVAFQVFFLAKAFCT